MLIVKEQATTQAFAFATLVMLEILTKKVAKLVSKFKQVTKVNFNMILKYLLFMTHVA